MRSAPLALCLAATMLLAACQSAPTPTTTTATSAAPKPAATTAPAAAPSTAPAASAKPAAAASPSAAAAASPSAAPAAAPSAVPAAASTPSTFSGPPVALEVSYSNLIADNLPEWQAFESGIFKQNGLDVHLQNIASSTGIPALIGGQVQVAHLGGSETLSAAAEGGDLVIIAVTGPVYPFVFMANSSIQNVNDLKGKKIGVSNIGSSSDIATRVMLTKVGLDPEKDVTIVPVGSLQNRMAAMLNGAIDGGVAQPPDQIALEDKGFHVIYDLAAQKLPSVGDCIVVQRQWLNQNKPVAQRYIDSIVQAIAFSKKNKTESLPVLSKYLNNDDQRAMSVTYDFFVGSVTPDYPDVKADLFGDAIEQLGAQNEKIKTFDLSSILDNEFVQSARDRHIGP
jgi:NitT/TauT family transport system substrate-binding protein